MLSKVLKNIYYRTEVKRIKKYTGTRTQTHIHTQKVVLTSSCSVAVTTPTPSNQRLMLYSVKRGMQTLAVNDEGRGGAWLGTFP